MADAPVGDDQFGEDLSVNRLQDEVAALLRKEAALFVPSGTMANQIALRTLTRPGDDVLVPAEAHVMWHESGAGAANAGVQFTSLGRGGRITLDELGASWKSVGHVIFPPTTLLVLENADDHASARLIATRIAAAPIVDLDPEAVATNIIVFRLAERRPDGSPALDAARSSPRAGIAACC